MEAALLAGAAIVNDVSGLTFDRQAASVVSRFGCKVILMHMRGTPATMDSLADYQDVVAEVKAELQARILAARQAGIRDEQIAIDPGFGFAKTGEHAGVLLRGLPSIVSLGYPVLAGVSRKRFIGTLSQEPRPDRRLGGSLAAGLFALARGASILRVHDVRETVQAVRVWHSLTG
jgi:dihydropteroate synthase